MNQSLNQEVASRLEYDDWDDLPEGCALRRLRTNYERTMTGAGFVTQQHARWEMQLAEYRATVTRADPESDLLEVARAQAGITVLERALAQGQEAARAASDARDSARGVWEREWTRYRRLVADLVAVRGGRRLFQPSGRERTAAMIEIEIRQLIG